MAQESSMKRWVYGSVAVSALVLAMGGFAAACEQHAKMSALQNPAAAAQTVIPQGWVVAQQDSDKGATSEENKEKSEDSK
jgi:hypothetical protein